jgi:hypothetical protein
VSSGAIVETLSVDTQVFVATGFGYSSKTFKSLKHHFSSDRLRLVMTEITVREVHSRIRLKVAEELARHKKFRKEANVLYNSSISDVRAALDKIDEEAVVTDLQNQFDNFLRESHAHIAPYDEVSAEWILDKYFSGKAPFGNSENKKFEFPDAFAVQVLSDWADKEDLDMFVVSGDQLFRDACAATERLHPKQTLAEVLNHVASDDAQLSDLLRAETLNRMTLIEQKAKDEFEDRYYWVEGENGDGQVQVQTIKLDSGPDIISIDPEETVIELTFNASYKAQLYYDDSATASYDSEDGTLIYVQHREEEVERT